MGRPTPKHLTDVTPDEWFAARDAVRMFQWLETADGRKLRLFAVAACRETWDRLSEPARGMVLVAERWADGDASRRELDRTRRRLEPEMTRTLSGTLRPLDAAAGTTATPRKTALQHNLIYNLTVGSFGFIVGPDASRDRFVGRLAGLLHDLFDNLFLTVATPPTLFEDGRPPLVFHPEWRTYNALGVARAIYAERAFDRMPILADALEDAGCDSPEVLEHCRGGGPHVRGCWVVDQVLGRC